MFVFVQGCQIERKESGTEGKDRGKGCGRALGEDTLCSLFFSREEGSLCVHPVRTNKSSHRPFCLSLLLFLLPLALPTPHSTPGPILSTFLNIY